MKKPKPPNLVTLAILTTVTVIFWVFFSVYSELTKKLDFPVKPQILAPILPTLDTDTLDQLENKNYFEDDQNFEFAVNPDLVVQDQVIIEEPTPVIDNTNTASPESTPESQQ